MDAFSSKTFITNTATGTYMVLCSQVQSTVYLLPGSLPCLDCSGISLMVPDPQTFSSGTLHSFPDPAGSRITLQFTDSQTSESVVLQVLAADGRVVLVRPITERSTEIDVQSWSNGTYHARMITSSGVLAQCSFVVQHLT